MINRVDNRLNYSAKLRENTPTATNKSFNFKNFLIDKTDISDTSTTSLQNKNENGRIYLGTISDQIPTVSDLLYTSSYKEDCWQILDKGVNSSKPYRQIPIGTDIYIDSKTSEIVWENDTQSSTAYKYKSQPTTYQSK
ncbi:MAG: hypothetical protein HQK65_16895, partial [Desulfamplus sp.]|nr:hypothetical protein [Desulfamplus sp.]